MAANNGQQTAIQKAAPSAVQTFRDYLEVRKPNLAQVLPRHVTADRVLKVALTAFNKTPALQSCTMPSLFQAVMQAGELGLEPGGALGHAYLVPYKDTCTLIVGYRGLIELARRSGEIESIEAHVVHANDKFDLKFGLAPTLSHEPCLDGDAGAMRFVYAVAKLKGGGFQFEVMTRQQVDAIKGRSKSGNSGPWQTDYEEMARKTVIRRLCKYLPLSPEKSELLAKALEVDAESDGPMIDVTPEPQATPAEKKASRTAKVLAEAKAAQAQQSPAEAPPHDESGEVVETTAKQVSESVAAGVETETHVTADGRIRIVDVVA